MTITKGILELESCTKKHKLKPVNKKKTKYFCSIISDNYKHRSEVRASLAANKDWINEYFGKITPMMTNQINVGLLSMEQESKPEVIYKEGQGLMISRKKISTVFSLLEAATSILYSEFWDQKFNNFQVILKISHIE